METGVPKENPIAGPESASPQGGLVEATGVKSADDTAEYCRVIDQLQETNERLQMVMNTIEEHINIIAPDGTVLWHNQGSYGPHAVPPDAKCWKVFEGRDARCPHCVHPDMFRDGKPRDYETRLGVGSASPTDWWVRAVPLRNKQGEIYAILESAIDITARKRAENEKANLEGQLRQAHKMEAVGRLAGGIAHDFNNLLMGIMGYVELCRELLPANHPASAYLNEITQSSQRSSSLVVQLLAFARKQVVLPKVLDLNATVEKMLGLLLRLIGEDISLSWRPGLKLWPVKIDPSQIDQILVNLCMNARDAIGGVGTITIETSNCKIEQAFSVDHKTVVPGEYVHLKVNDNGCGMEKEVQEHIFEPFFTTKDVGEGTGLGLATVHGVIEQNKGYIDVISAPGKGSAFSIYLPRFTGEVEEVRARGAISVPQARGETVLVVEDELSLREICRLFLNRLGYKTLVAETPEVALNLAGQYTEPIHLLLTDVIMPGMNGRELARTMSSLKPNIRPLFMSGYTADIIVRQGVVDEGVHFLAKPFSCDALALKVREVLDS